MTATKARERSSCGGEEAALDDADVADGGMSAETPMTVASSQIRFSRLMSEVWLR